MPYSPEKTLALIHEARQKTFPLNAGVVHDGFTEFINSDKQIAGYLTMESGIPGPVRSFFRQKIKEYINGEFVNIETPDDTFVE
jgi:hypothetical protein